jgi:glutamine synthetase
MISTNIFGSKVFDDEEMRVRLDEASYRRMHECKAMHKPLPLEVANAVAEAMKNWAVEQGATHYTHWFQPMTGITAEKHEAFLDLDPASQGGAIFAFSGKALIKGESDASSFPSGGLRATFEARGYTAWDPTSYAFIKDNTLCIPTAFCSFNGQALDKKTPLLRSMQALSKQGVRLLHLLGNASVKHVFSTVGAEQEYFLIDEKMYRARPDLVYTGRTLLGSRAPKGQDLDDHYYGAIKPRVAAFMADLDQELWALGVRAKTEHNEVAPAQHELAPIYDTANIATDHNQLTMEMMRKVAKRHGLACLLHEKPFEGINGSGKHNNWSLMTDTGVNLFDPGNCPEDNLQFILVVSAVIKAVDTYQDLLRIAAASAGNDHRLSAAEAPPSVVSMFLGDELTGVLKAIEENRSYSKRARCDVEIGVKVLPRFAMDTSDRNRTSPFAFTGNKFEFRMPGAACSIADANTVLNTIVADAMSDFADRLEGAEDVAKCAKTLIRDTLLKHGRIIYNGNNYSTEWYQEAERRGLMRLENTPDALSHLTDAKNVDMYVRNGVYSREEIEASKEILLDNYNKTLHIEAVTLIDMVRREVLPAVLDYIEQLSRTTLQLDSLGIEAPKGNLSQVCDLYRAEEDLVRTLSENVSEATAYQGAAAADVYAHKVIPAMRKVRDVADDLERLTPKKYWRFPSYGDILFSVD